MILESVRQFAATPLICAVDVEGTELSFRELDERSDALACSMIRLMPEKAPVLLMGDKENDMLVAMFAAIKSGHAYVPLTPSVPPQRAEYIQKDSGAALIIDFSGNMPDAPGIPRLDAAGVAREIDLSYGRVPDEKYRMKPEDMIMLLYTSGSTGTPKGVINRLGDIEHLFAGSPAEYYIGFPGARIMNSIVYMFSAHIQQVYRSMACLGSCMYAVPARLQRNIHDLVDYYLRIQPHNLGLIATMCVQLLTDSRFCRQQLPHLSRVAISGEVVSRKLLEQVFERFPDITVLIQYASTEMTTVTVGSIITRCDFDNIDTEVIPIGEPMPPVEAHLWDDNGNEVPDGEKGELVVINRKMCPGYWKAPELTREAFFDMPDGRRGYHTRDLMIRRNGKLYYAGRLDNRVKLGGNRVELEEVETALCRLPEVYQAVVRPVYRDGLVVSLTAYITLRDKQAAPLKSIIAIKKGLGAMVSSYMIPQKIVIMESFKTNSSGKIDRAAIRIDHEKNSKE